MLTVHGKYGTATIMTDAIDADAWSFLHRIMSAGVAEGSRVAIMPDCHSGSGCVIGFTQQLDATNPRLCPSIIGVDIGCNISSLRLELGRDMETPERLAELDRFIRAHIGIGLAAYVNKPLSRAEKALIRKEEAAAFEEADQLIAADGRGGKPMSRSILGQLKSIGSGNHFIELGKDEEGAFWLTVHSGSRELGRTIAQIYQKYAVESCTDRCERDLRYLDRRSPYYDHYLMGVNACQHFSRLNHRLVLKTIADFLQPQRRWREDALISTMHNYIDLGAMIVRKGAVRALAGEKLLIPFNMRDGIAICEGRGNPDWNHSAPHGAGRLLSRAQAKVQLDLDAARADMANHGIFTTSLDYCLDETAAAYKPMEDILAHIGPSVKVCSMIRPVYNIKGRS